MGLSSIANNWDQFVKDWCLDVVPPFNQAHAIRALEALEHHWPERVGILVSGGRGIGAVVYPIRLGAMLADVSDCRGFASVLARARGGEVGAESELAVAACFRRIGFEPRLQAEIGGKVLDVAVDVDETVVYFEVVAPERSDLDKDAQERVTRASQILGAVDGQHVRVELVTFPTDEVIEQIITGIEKSPLGQWTELPQIARWRRDELPDGGRRSEFSWPANEYRAGRLISAEYHHFAADVPYVLVVNTGSTLLDPDGWTAAFARCFQPTRNRRVGASVAYMESLWATDFVFRWSVRVLENTHAHHPVPARLLQALRAIDHPLHQAIANA